MKLMLFPVMAACLALACNTPSNRPQISGPAADTPVREVYAGKTTDTPHGVKTKHAEADDSADTEENLDTVLHRTVAGFRQPYVVDTLFEMDGNTFQLHLKHYCLMDSALRLPKTYTDIYKLDSFVAHNFATQVKLDRDGKTILARTVYKKDFEKFLFPELREYATLFAPSVKIVHDTILLGYSISIPLTDVGIGATMVIDNKGGVHFIE